MCETNKHSHILLNSEVKRFHLLCTLWLCHACCMFYYYRNTAHCALFEAGGCTQNQRKAAPNIPVLIFRIFRVFGNFREQTLILEFSVNCLFARVFPLTSSFIFCEYRRLCDFFYFEVFFNEKNGNWLSIMANAVHKFVNSDFEFANELHIHFSLL